LKKPLFAHEKADIAIQTVKYYPFSSVEVVKVFVEVDRIF
jgi:hypothetical protein